MIGLLAIAYLISPIDIIPDWIPILGLLDEMILIPILLAMIMRLLATELRHDTTKTSTDYYCLNQ